MTLTLDRPRRAAVPHARVEGITRREFIGGASLVALLTACGPDTADEPADTAGGEFPVTIEHKYGSTEIPEVPSRVVTVGLTEQDYVIALGITPVGVREWFGGHPGALWPWARERIGDDPVPTVLPRTELNYEQIASLGPDLVLGVNSGLTQEEYNTLAQLAPTVAQPADHPDFGAPWQEITRTVGRALGKREQAEQLVPDLERRFEQVRAEHPEFDGATGILATTIDGTPYVYAEGPAPGFLRALGLELPADVEALFTGENREPVELSLEQLALLNADVLVLGVYGDPATSVARNPLYQELDVAREGRDIHLPEMSRLNGALSFGSILSLPVALDELVPRLAAAIDGDPATKVEPVA